MDDAKNMYGCKTEHSIHSDLITDVHITSNKVQLL